MIVKCDSVYELVSIFGPTLYQKKDPAMLKLLFRNHLRRRIFRELLKDQTHVDKVEAVLFSNLMADEILARVDAAKDAGDGGLLEFIKNIDWAKLLEIILAVIALMGPTEIDVD